MNIQELNKQLQDKQSEIFKKYGVFWAFSDEQFEKNKTPLEEGDVYVGVLGGGACPKSKYKDFMTELGNLHKWHKDQINSTGQREKYILYELNNHEAFYTGEIEDTLDSLGSNYTAEEVWKVFNENKEKAYKAMGW